MGLKAVLESLDDVPDGVRDFYVEKDGGGFRLDVEGVETKGEVHGLKSALEKQKRETQRAKELLSSIPEDLDGRLAELEQLRQEKAEQEQKKAEEAGEWETLKAHLVEEHKKKLDERDARLAERDKKLDRLLRENVARDAVAKRKASTKLLLPHIMAQTRLQMVDGEERAVVIGDDGKVRYSEGDALMTIDDLVNEMGKDPEFEGAFPASDATGGGASGRRVAEGGHEVTSKAGLKDRAAKSAFIDAHGIDAYNALPPK